MTITIITAAWNISGVKKAIESIDNQTYKDWNHLIINDNNPEVRKEMAGLCDNEKRFWIDMGVRTHYYGCFARNIGLMAAFSYIRNSKRDIDNEWVTFHDDDNLWTPDHLATMVKAIKTKAGVSIVASDAVWVGVKDKDWQEIRPCRLRHGGCDLGQFIYKTKLFREYGFFFAHPRRKHKWDWELLKKITTGEEDRFVYTDKPTFIMKYRKR